MTVAFSSRQRSGPHVSSQLLGDILSAACCHFACLKPYPCRRLVDECFSSALSSERMTSGAQFHRIIFAMFGTSSSRKSSETEGCEFCKDFLTRNAGQRTPSQTRFGSLMFIRRLGFPHGDATGTPPLQTSTMKSASALVVPKLFMSACRQQPSVTFERMQPHLQRFRHGVEIENIPPVASFLRAQPEFL
jgi:hypothetical protein